MREAGFRHSAFALRARPSSASPPFRIMLQEGLYRLALSIASRKKADEQTELCVEL